MDFFLALEELIDAAVDAGVPPEEILSELRAKVAAMEAEA